MMLLSLDVLVAKPTLLLPVSPESIQIADDLIIIMLS